MRDLNNIQAMSILVVGDVMIDTYYDGDIMRISPEAPVPVFRKKTERSLLGGAANVAANLVAAGQNVSMMAMVGNDTNGTKLKNIFESKGIAFGAKKFCTLSGKACPETAFSKNPETPVPKIVRTRPVTI